MNPGSGRDFRQGQNKQRMRGRGNNNNNNNRKGPNPLTRSYESNGPDVKIRGTALHIAEKYVQLARDAQVAGDRVAAENYLQHAEHYYRIIAAAQAQMPQPQPVFRSDDEGDEEEGESRANGFGQQPRTGEQPSFGGNEPQPFVNGNGQGQSEEEPQRPPASTHTEEGRFEPQENFADRGGGDYNRDNNQRGGQNDRGGYRGRRRRPFRERFGQQGGGDGQGATPAPAGGDAPSGDEQP